MPWVIADYESETLDLYNHKTFRDLRKPVGALNPKRLEDFKMRWDMLGDDAGIPRFFYGSHYSNAGMVLLFLMRLEPFTSLHIDLQSGRFDAPDRLFFSVADCFRCCLKLMADVKELTPEFYCLPDFLLNSENLPLGERQDNMGPVCGCILSSCCAYCVTAVMRPAELTHPTNVPI